jgi:hypothetical protein
MKKVLLVTLLASAIGSIALPATSATIILRTAPPAPRAEVVPPARRGYVWTQGYWDYSGNKHRWVKGSYVRERRGYAYREPKWEERGGRWQLQRGIWVRGAGRDRDGDGVRNRDDSRPNNPNRQ